MSVAIPTSEPDRITAGDTVAWTQSFTDYPATDGWTLHYALQSGNGGQITIDATANGAGYAVNVASSVSLTWTPGVYFYTAYVTNGAGERHTVKRGNLSLLANPAAALTPSHAIKTLGLINDALEGRIPRGLETTNIDGQELSRIPIDTLFELKLKYQRIVNQETAAANRAAGGRSRALIGIRFVNPR